MVKTGRISPPGPRQHLRLPLQPCIRRKGGCDQAKQEGSESMLRSSTGVQIWGQSSCQICRVPSFSSTLRPSLSTPSLPASCLHLRDLPPASDIYPQGRGQSALYHLPELCFSRPAWLLGPEAQSRPFSVPGHCKSIWSLLFVQTTHWRQQRPCWRPQSSLLVLPVHPGASRHQSAWCDSKHSRQNLVKISIVTGKIRVGAECRGKKEGVQEQRRGRPPSRCGWRLRKSKQRNRDLVLLISRRKEGCSCLTWWKEGK